jgi:hypothetical protein
VTQPTSHPGAQLGGPFTASITLEVFNVGAGVWRVSGLALSGERIVAVWPSADSGEMELHTGTLSALASRGDQKRTNPSEEIVDVTPETVLNYGGHQEFDKKSSNLELCLTIGNRGKKALRTPIRLEAIDLDSTVGQLSIRNATNGLKGAGAFWDISRFLTGSQLPPLADSNPFCLSLHLDVAASSDLNSKTGRVMTLEMRVLANE